MVTRHGLAITASRRRDLGAPNSRRHRVFDNHSISSETGEIGAILDRVGNCIKEARTRCEYVGSRTRRVDRKGMNRNERSEGPAAPFAWASAGAVTVPAASQRTVRVVKAYLR
jgi:hypothetical protein